MTGRPEAAPRGVAARLREGLLRRSRRPAGAARLLVGLLALALVLVVTKNAWLCDDAFITFRSVENAVLGHGLVWNPGERVQTFTNPLWTLVLALLRPLTGELVLTAMLGSIALTGLAAALLARGASGSAAAAVALVALVASRAFTDFSTSGLENALGHLLLVGFVLCARRMRGAPRAFLGAALCAGLAVTNRMDAALLVAPALLAAAWTLPRARAAGLLALGAAPFLLWEAFALAYYGFPFPNTAYAKLGTGVDAAALVQQGLVYLRHSLANDPATLGATLLAAAWLARERGALAWSALAGLALALLYVVWVGGDFMSGRFLAAPLVVALAWAASGPALPVRLAWPAAALLLAGGALAPRSHLWSGSDYGRGEADRANQGFVNVERAFYFQATALVLCGDAGRFLRHPWIDEGRALRAEAEAREGGEPVVRVTAAIGFLGFYAGPRVRVYDIFALADPLLARLPAEDARTPVGLAIGHFARLVPQGFVPARARGEPFPDPALERLDRALGLARSGPLLARERWGALWRLNTGGHDADVAEYLARPPLARDADALPAGGGLALGRAGAEVRFADRLHVPALALACDPRSLYELRFLDGAAERGRTTSQPAPEPSRPRAVAVPAEAREKGFDRVRVVPLFGFGDYRLDALRPAP